MEISNGWPPFSVYTHTHTRERASEGEPAFTRGCNCKIPSERWDAKKTGWGEKYTHARSSVNSLSNKVRCTPAVTSFGAVTTPSYTIHEILVFRLACCGGGDTFFFHRGMFRDSRCWYFQVDGRSRFFVDGPILGFLNKFSYDSEKCNQEICKVS